MGQTHLRLPWINDQSRSRNLRHFNQQKSDAYDNDRSWCQRNQKAYHARGRWTARRCGNAGPAREGPSIFAPWRPAPGGYKNHRDSRSHLPWLGRNHRLSSMTTRYKVAGARSECHGPGAAGWSRIAEALRWGWLATVDENRDCLGDGIPDSFRRHLSFEEVKLSAVLSQKWVDWKMALVQPMLREVGRRKERCH